MANATPRDTRAGFDIYREAGGETSIEVVNARLDEAGYGPIKPRTFGHYRKLLLAGYDRYISINRFDVARASVPYENASSNGRYSYRHADVGVRVTFAKSSKLLEASGRAVEVGEVGAILRFSDEQVVAGLRRIRPRPGDMVSVRYLEAGRSVGGRVVESDLKSEPISIEVEYSRLLSIAAVAYGAALPLVDAPFVLSGDLAENQTLDLVGRQLYHFFELIEGVRALVNHAGAAQEHAVYAEPPVLRSLSVASPAELVVGVAGLLASVVGIRSMTAMLRTFGELVDRRKIWLEGSGQRIQNEILKIDKESKELDLRVKHLETDLKVELLERLRSELAGTTIDKDVVEQLVRDHVLDPLKSLAESGIRQLGPVAPEAGQEGSELGAAGGNEAG